MICLAALTHAQTLEERERLGPLAARFGRLVVARNAGDLAATAAAGIPWAIDNEAFSSWDEQRFRRLLDRAEGAPACLFCAAPDVVGDARATLELWASWAPELRRRGFPPALVAQDGLELAAVPWEELDALFLGGTDAWKLGEEAAALCREAKRRGLWVHAGRVNSRRRALLVRSFGADSFDGLKWAKFRSAHAASLRAILSDAEQTSLAGAAA